MIGSTFIFITNRFSSALDTICSCPQLSLLAVVYIPMTNGDDKRLTEFVSRKGIPSFNSIRDYIASRLERPDFLAVYSLHKKLSSDELSFPKKAAVNLHPSLLPAYRGPNPWFWQYYDGVKTSGFTTYKMTEKMDSGDILCQEKFVLNYKMSQRVFSEKMIAEIGAPLLCSSIINYELITPIQQKNFRGYRWARNITDYHNDVELTKMTLAQKKILKTVYPDCF